MKKGSKNNSILEHANNIANNMNNNVKRIVRNEIAINIIRVLLILYTALVIPNMEREQLEVLDNNLVKLIVCSLIVYLGFIDIVTAVLITIAFVLTLLQLRKKGASNNNNNNNNINDVDSNIIDKINNLTNVQVENYEDLFDELRRNENNEPNEPNKPRVKPQVNGIENTINNARNVDNTGLNNIAPNNETALTNEIVGNNNEVAANIVANNANNANNDNNANNSNNANNANNANNNEANIPKPHSDDEYAIFNSNNNLTNNKEINNKLSNDYNKLSIEEKNNAQPASNTLTDNILLAQNAELDNNAPIGLTTSQNLYDISENSVPGGDIMNQVKTFESQHSAQGMDWPTGNDIARHEGYHYSDNQEHPTLNHEMLRNNAVVEESNNRNNANVNNSNNNNNANNRNNSN